MYTRIPFGLCNAPSHFQRVMASILEDSIEGLKCVRVYIDDIVIFSTTWETHLRDIRSVLERLEKYGIKINPGKCTFAQNGVKLLGHYISKKGIELDEEHSHVINHSPRPKNIKE